MFQSTISLRSAFKLQSTQWPKLRKKSRFQETHFKLFARTTKMSVCDNVPKWEIKIKGKFLWALYHHSCLTSFTALEKTLKSYFNWLMFHSNEIEHCRGFFLRIVVRIINFVERWNDIISFKKVQTLGKKTFGGLCNTAKKIFFNESLKYLITVLWKFKNHNHMKFKGSQVGNTDLKYFISVNKIISVNNFEWF